MVYVLIRTRRVRCACVVIQIRTKVTVRAGFDTRMGRSRGKE